jgi:acetyltransferase-like isoleucine patch superfamily enzyme
MFEFIFSIVYNKLQEASKKQKNKFYRKQFKIHTTASLNHIENIWLKGNVEIGANTYINSGRFISGLNTKIIIGEWCAIGHNVNVIGWTHDIIKSTGPLDERPTLEKDIIIGNHNWIGTNVFIREGVVIGNNTIIAANSVVTENVPDNTIVGGIPAKIIKSKI